ncbi:BKACE family enzyme [Peristeroidobacter soli]|jgi:uncharacterized protein (DUF849 family)|uniref:3-keto-5-aminohexanoate cleavage protein n=1 Tax=Peristeroidobacter soli TaxID=2497877 RepID=UPI00101C96A8|nr:3-keto-5-aminohexanoate cleavage protein [Peristeroidobacter soli]
MKRNKKVILTCAVTGGGEFNRKHPAFPVTPAQIADAAIEACKAGAAIAHIHVRDPKTGSASRDPALYREVVDRIRQSGSRIIINLTGGMGAHFMPDPAYEGRALPESDIASVEERMEHMRDCLPDMASLDLTTSNQSEGGVDSVYLNTTRTLRAMATQMQQLRIKPELEVFAAGDILFGQQLIKEGLIDGPPLFQFVLGVLWGAPADTGTVQYMKSLLPPDAEWGALGIGPLEMPMVAQVAMLGGHVRVGLEDNLYLKRGVFATNGQLVERAREIVTHLGYELATIDEARRILALRSAG